MGTVLSVAGFLLLVVIIIAVSIGIGYFLAVFTLLAKNNEEEESQYGEDNDENN